MTFYRLFCMCVILVLALSPIPAAGSGFEISHLSARASAMGNAYVAQADDPSALYYNPAGLVQTKGIQLQAGVSTMLPSMTFTSSTKTPGLRTYPGHSPDMFREEFYIPNLYLTQKYNDKLAWGIGWFSNFGITTDWPDNWEGRYTPGGTYSEIKTQSINPVIALQPSKYISISAGYVHQYMSADMRNMINHGLGAGPDSEVKVNGDDWGSGWNAGLMFFFFDHLRFGASFRSQIKHSLVGDVTIKGNPNNNMHSGHTLGVNLPAIFQTGISWTQAPFTVEFDYKWTQWSTYDSLQVNLTKSASVSEIVKDWGDASSFHLGGSYNVVKNLDLRAGLTFEPEMIPNRTLDLVMPSGDRWTYSVGFGGIYGKILADFSYSYSIDNKRNFNNDVGNYVYYTPAPVPARLTGVIADVRTHTVDVSITYKFK